MWAVPAADLGHPLWPVGACCAEPGLGLLP